MKKPVLLLLIALMALGAYAQDTARFNMGGIKILVIDPDKDSDGNEKIEIEFPENWENSKTETTSTTDSTKTETTDITIEPSSHKKGNKKIAHYAGLELGMNSYLTSKNDFNYENPLYNLDMARSYSLNLNFMEHKLPLFGGYAGLVTGMGATWNHYSFDKNTILTGGGDAIQLSEDTENDYSKNTLRATYLKVPLMLEFNTSLREKKSFHVGFGAEAGVKLGSRTIRHFTDGSYKNEVESRGPYHLNPFRVNAMAKVGYRNFTLFANYALTSMFEKGEGENLYPFEVGIRLLDF